MANIMTLFEQSEKYKAGEVIIHEGEKNRDLYVLSEGTLEVSVSDKSKKIVVSEINPPEILGEISFLNGSPRTATVSAKTDVEMFILSYKKVQQELSNTEDRIQAARRFFNANVRDLNTRLEVFPSNLLGSAFHFQAYEYFEVERSVIRDVVDVNFDAAGESRRNDAETAN